MTIEESAPDINNEWRLATPGSDGWARSARPDAADKFFMVSADGHVQEPNDFLETRVDPKWHPRLPGMLSLKDGTEKKLVQVADGFRKPLKVNDIKFEGEDRLRNRSGRTPDDRIAELAADGVDAEILFPNKGLTVWATQDPALSHAMCHAYNEWAWEVFADYNDVLLPIGAIAPGDVDVAIAEIQRCADLGFRWPCAALQAEVRPSRPQRSQLQPPRVRPAVGGDLRGRPTGHVPRVDRTRPAHISQPWRRCHQLRRPLVGADDGADRQHLRVRRRRAVPQPPVRYGRGGHRLGRVGHPGDG